MKNTIHCFGCHKRVELESCGDLWQFTGDTLDCPCGEEALVPRFVSELDGWCLVAIADLEVPSAIAAQEAFQFRETSHDR